jgi:hypothetical protein
VVEQVKILLVELFLAPAQTEAILYLALLLLQVVVAEGEVILVPAVRTEVLVVAEEMLDILPGLVLRAKEIMVVQHLLVEVEEALGLLVAVLLQGLGQLLLFLVHP